MAKSVQNIKNLLNDFVIQVSSGLVISAIIVIASNIWLGVVAFSLFIVAIVVYLLSGKYRRLYKLIKAGGRGYYNSFDQEDNYKVFEESNQTFCYMGISANSIIELFRKWIASNPTVKSYSFLLMNPDSHNLRRQKAFERGIDLNADLSELDRSLHLAINEDVEAEKKRITSAIAVLKTLQPFKEGKLTIRFYEEFPPWWMYIIDDQKVFVGILEKGKRGQNSPVMEISKVHEFSSLYNTFRNIWEIMWLNAKEV